MTTISCTNKEVVVAPGVEWLEFSGPGGAVVVPSDTLLFDEHPSLVAVLAGYELPEILWEGGREIGRGGEARINTFGASSLKEVIKRPAMEEDYKTLLGYLRYGGVCLQTALYYTPEKWQSSIGSELRTPNYLGMVSFQGSGGVIMSHEQGVKVQGLDEYVIGFHKRVRDYCTRALVDLGIRNTTPLVDDILPCNLIAAPNKPQEHPLVVIDAAQFPHEGIVW
jgi:hypothetical protein